MKIYLKSEASAINLKSQMSFLATSYACNYKPSKNTLTKHRILKNLRNNKDIIITKPDKGAGVVILNKNDYIKMSHEIINDKAKFKQLKKDVTLTRETALQKFLLRLKKKGAFNDVEYIQSVRR